MPHRSLVALVGAWAALAGCATTLPAAPASANAPVPSTASAPAPAVTDAPPAAGQISAEIVAAGTATADGVSSQSAPDTAAGSVAIIPGEVQIQPGTTIAARVGVGFGLRVIVGGAPRGTVVPVRTRVTHPPITDPRTGKAATVDAWATPMNAGIPRYTGWRFDNPWEVVPGAWRIELLDGARPIAVQDFTVAAP